MNGDAARAILLTRSSTGQLEPRTAKRIINLLQDVIESEKTMVVVEIHDEK